MKENTEKLRPRKILILMSRYGLWGDEINLLRLLAKLDTQRIQPLILLPDDSPQIKEHLTQLGVEVWQRTMPAWRKPKGWFGMALYIGEIVWEIYKRKIDLVFGLNVSESPIAVISGWLTGRPSIVWFQDSLISPKKARSYLLHRCDAIIAISKYMQEKVAQISPKTQTTVIYNGVDPEHFDPSKISNRLRQELGISENEMVVGMIGRITDLKGQLELIQAAKVLKKRGLSIRVLFAGSEKPDYKKKLEKAIQEAGLQHQIIFLEFQEEIAPVIAAIDIFALLSINEAFSLAMAEAMAMEKPCIYTSVGGVNELVGEEDIGISVNRDDPEQIADAIRQLAQNPAERKRKGANARNRILQEFTLEKQVRLFEEFLCETE